MHLQAAMQYRVDKKDRLHSELSSGVFDGCRTNVLDTTEFVLVASESVLGFKWSLCLW
jgi:hypothetical protein